MRLRLASITRLHLGVYHSHEQRLTLPHTHMAAPQHTLAQQLTVMDVLRLFRDEDAHAHACALVHAHASAMEGGDGRDTDNDDSWRKETLL